MVQEPQRTGGEWNALIDNYQGMVYGLALARTGSPQDAEDVFQEVFLALFRSGKAFREEEHRKAWLLRTTLNMARRITRSTWRQKTVPLEEGEKVPAPFREPGENRVWEALQSLSQDYRLPLYLFYFEELPTDQIAKVLSLSPGTVRKRLSRGREQLKAWLEGGSDHG